MEQFFCKNCGGPLAISNTSRFAECDFCGGKFELDLNRAVFANLYSAADDAWNRKDFDDALKYYLQIVEKDNLQSEAHWGAALCRYGIAYEIDPVSGEKKPTCNRINNESIFEDKNYLAAIDHASPDNRKKYMRRASEIDRISVEFLKIVKSTTPYDVFISYKRTDERGLKTTDAEYAMKLYLYLKNHGIQVFFAEESLKNVAGSQYEPHIFAALQSSKVMVLMGSSKENVESTWVKNEWQRFLKLMEQAPEKSLIPAVLGDPYEVLPHRLQRLQALHAGSPAFVEEVLETIKKKLSGTAKPAASASAEGQPATVKSLLERAFMLVADGEFEKSSAQLEKVLDISPKYAEAYLCSLMVEFRVKQEHQLAQLSQRIDLSNNYQKIMSFGSKELKERVYTYAQTIANRIGAFKQKEQELLQKKQTVMTAISNADALLQPMENKKNSLQSDIAREANNFVALKNKITEAQKEKELYEHGRTRGVPILLTLLAVIVAALAFFMTVKDAKTAPTTAQLFLYYFLPQIIICSTLLAISFSGESFIGSFFTCLFFGAFLVFFLTFVVVCVVNSGGLNGGGLMTAILGFFWDMTLGLLFNDKKVLTALNLQQTLFFSSYATCLASIVCGIILQCLVGKNKRYIRSLSSKIVAYQKEYDENAAQNNTLIRLKQELAQLETAYNTRFEGLRDQLRQENREYLAFAQKNGFKAESLLPSKYS